MFTRTFDLATRAVKALETIATNLELMAGEPTCDFPTGISENIDRLITRLWSTTEALESIDQTLCDGFGPEKEETGADRMDALIDSYNQGFAAAKNVPFFAPNCEHGTPGCKGRGEKHGCPS